MDVLEVVAVVVVSWVDKQSNWRRLIDRIATLMQSNETGLVLIVREKAVDHVWLSR